MAKHKLTKSKKQKATVETVPGVQFEETPIDGATPAEVEEQAPAMAENSPEEGVSVVETEGSSRIGRRGGPRGRKNVLWGRN